MIITGIGDEAGTSIEKQIKAHKQLGWDFIELRLVNGKNIAGELPDKEFDASAAALEKNGMKVSCFSSAIGNWSRPVNGDFKIDTEELRKAILRMKRLDTKYIRIMSWVNEVVSEHEWRTEAIRRCRELAKLAEDTGITLVHENCTGWGGLDAMRMLELRNEVDSPAFQLLYDIGNVISHGDEPWPFFKTIRQNFVYIHIKDAVRNPEGGKSQNYAYCGEGDAMLAEILEKIINEDGYDGFISIEPHVAAIVHLSGQQVSDEDKYSSYIKYAEKLKSLIAKIRKTPR